MNKIDTYGYAVFRLAGLNYPAHIVEISSTLLAGFSVFNSAKDAKDYIEKEKASLAGYGVKLEYDPDFTFSPGLLSAYKKESNNGMFTKLENKHIYKRG